jgi:hypothetical protein
VKAPNYRAAAPARTDSVRRAMQTGSALERPVNQAMQRRLKLSDALGKLAKK